MKPISQTAYYCCGVRMLDARSPAPVCGDGYAGRFMDDEGLRVLDRFRDEHRANAANVARHRIIDDLLRAAVRADPATAVVLVGAGFDTRAFRLPAGTWVEADEPPLIARKEERLPAAGCGNPLRRVPVDFGAAGGLAAAL